MKRDVVQMQHSQAQKEYLKVRWRRNETNYLREVRERRQKVDVIACVKPKNHRAWLSNVVFRFNWNDEAPLMFSRL